MIVAYNTVKDDKKCKSDVATMAYSDGRSNPTNIKSFGDCETLCTAHAAEHSDTYTVGTGFCCSWKEHDDGTGDHECFISDVNQFDKKDDNNWKVALGSVMSI